MALLSNYSDANKVIQNEPVVQYRAEPTLYGKTNPIVAYWTLTRSSSGTHRYVGMTKAAALACAEALKADYTRKYAEWEAQVTDGDGSPIVTITPRYKFECAADISVDHAAGSAYEVSVTSNDTDIIITTEEPKSIADFEAIFQAALARDVPMTTLYLAVESADYYSSAAEVVVNYIHKGSNFDLSKVGIEVKVGNTWQSVSLLATATDSKVRFAANSNVTFRITYDTNAAYSKEYTTNTPDAPNLQTQSCAKVILAAQGVPSTTVISVPYQISGRVKISGSLHIEGCAIIVRNAQGAVIDQCRFDGYGQSTIYQRPSYSIYGDCYNFNYFRFASYKFADIASVAIEPVDAMRYLSSAATPTVPNYLNIVMASYASGTLNFSIKSNLAVATEVVEQYLTAKEIVAGQGGETLQTISINSVSYDPNTEKYDIVATPSAAYNGTLVASIVIPDGGGEAHSEYTRVSML